jgi:hypothetical protein
MKNVKVYVDMNDKREGWMARYIAMYDLFHVMIKLKIIKDVTMVDTKDHSWTHKIRFGQ